MNGKVNTRCSCCPPNINRLLADIPEYIYEKDGQCVYINQFAPGRFESDGISVVQKTDYPHSGRIDVTAEGTEYVMVRIPEWCKNYTVSCDYISENGYAKIGEKSFWIEFEIVPKFISANPRVMHDAGKAAVTMGPIVYCIEGIDNGKDLHNLYLDTKEIPEICENELFELPILKAKGYAKKAKEALYSELDDEYEPREIILIPYHCFANRGESDMRVWINYIK